MRATAFWVRAFTPELWPNSSRRGEITDWRRRDAPAGSAAEFRVFSFSTTAGLRSSWLAQAATIILDGVKVDRWRILVGADAHKVDEMVRQSPERATASRPSLNPPAGRGGPTASLSRIRNPPPQADTGISAPARRICAPKTAAAPFRKVAAAALVARKPLKERLPCRESDCFGLGDRMNR